MQIKQVDVLKVKLPFAVEFSHSLRKRLYVKNVIVLLKDSSGNILGGGEGAPRTYVTGESPDTVIQNIGEIVGSEKFPWEINDIKAVKDFIDTLPESKEFNASICAIETALLDAFAKNRDKRVIDFFSHSHFSNSITYGGVLPLGSEELVIKICSLIRKAGISDLKLKLGPDYFQNKSLFKLVSEQIPYGYKLKVDVNCAWDKENGVRHIPLLKENNVSIIEQPMVSGSPEMPDFSKYSGEHGMVLMADESACSMSDIKELVSERSYGMVNIRISKCGGLIRSIRIAEFLRASNIPFQIGCQLGESGILSAAGRSLSLLCSDAVSFEGSYDKLLLAENVTKDDISFGYGGTAFQLEGPGFGAEVDVSKIERMAESSVCFFNKR